PPVTPDASPDEASQPILEPEVDKPEEPGATDEPAVAEEPAKAEEPAASDQSPEPAEAEKAPEAEKPAAPVKPEPVTAVTLGLIPEVFVSRVSTQLHFYAPEVALLPARQG